MLGILMVKCCNILQYQSPTTHSSMAYNGGLLPDPTQLYCMHQIYKHQIKLHHVCLTSYIPKVESIDNL